MTGPTPPPRNGMSVTTACLSEGLADYGVDLRLVDTADRRGLKNVGRLDGGNVLAAFRHGARFAWMLVRLRPQIVYVPIAQNRLGFLRDALFLLPARLSNAEVVVHLHGCAFRAFYTRTDPFTRRVIRAALSQVACAIVLGPNARLQFDLLIPRSRVRVIENGVPDSPQPSQDHRPEAVAQGEAKVLYLGALTIGKGFLDLLRAIPLLGDFPGLQFVFAGEYTTAQAQTQAEQLIVDHALSDRVRMLGPVSSEHAQRLLQQAAVLVLPAIQTEGQPLVILEAFREGTPVIATPKGCIADTVTDGVDGLLIPPERPEAVASAIRGIVSDPVRWQHMSEAARDTYERRFRVETWVASLAQLFEEVRCSEGR